MIERSVRVFKYEALQNSYLILDPRFPIPDMLLEPSGWETLRPRSQFVRSLCDPCAGIGSNGLLFGPMGAAVKNRYRLLIINSDGTPAGFSGNGTRIFAKYLMDIETAPIGQLLEIEIANEEASGSLAWNIAKVQLPPKIDGPIEVTAPYKPRFGPQSVRAAANTYIALPSSDYVTATTFTIPALADLGHAIYASPNAWSSSTLIDIGNPHCVTFVRERPQLPKLEVMQKYADTLKEIAFRKNGPARLFADGINLQWIWPESRQRLSLVIYERGEGPTPASGSSACATACAAFRLGLTENEVEVGMPGGTLAVKIEGTAADIQSVTLRGHAHLILDGMVSVGEPAPLREKAILRDRLFSKW